MRKLRCSGRIGNGLNVGAVVARKKKSDNNTGDCVKKEHRHPAASKIEKRVLVAGFNFAVLKSSTSVLPPFFREPDGSPWKKPGAAKNLMEASEPTSPAAGKPKLLDQARQILRANYDSQRTEELHVGWMRRFILFHDKAHPKNVGSPELAQFLPDRTVQGAVSASTQKSACQRSLVSLIRRFWINAWMNKIGGGFRAFFVFFVNSPISISD